MKHKVKKFFLIFFSLLSIPHYSMGDSHYPTSVPVRPYATDQLTGSCMAHAYVNALEHAFNERHIPIRFSIYFNHAFNWLHEPSHVNVTVTEKDKKVLQKYQGIVFDFMHPLTKDGTFLNILNDQDFIPSPTDMGVIDESMTPFVESKIHKTFSSNYSNTINFQELIKYAKNNFPATLSIHGSFISRNCNYITGLCDFEADSTWHNEATNHAVAIVGFDDSLYNSTGGLIVKNSWSSYNKQSEIYEAEKNLKKYPDLSTSIEYLNEVKKFRYKLPGEKNYPEYYALPYAYIHKLIQNAKQNGSAVEFFLPNYNTAWSEHVRLQKDYQIHHTPFFCSNEMNSLRNIIFQYQQAKKKGTELYYLMKLLIIPDGFGVRQRLASNYSSSELTYSSFKYAKLIVHKTKSIDQTRDLYSGKWNNFYCPDSEVIPSIDFYNHYVQKLNETFPESPQAYNVAYNSLTIEAWRFFIETLAQFYQIGN